MTKLTKFLITREITSARETQEILSLYNFHSAILPLSKINLLNISLPKVTDISAIIFTSKNALKIKDYEFWAQCNKDIPFFIIGSSFAKLLEKNHIKNIYYFDSVKDLVSYFSTKEKNQTILYLRGKQISYNLKNLLAQNIVEKICYEMIYQDIEAQKIINFINTENITDILFFSSLNVGNFLAIMKNDIEILKNYNIVCLSSEIAKIFINRGFDKVVYPENPNLDELLIFLSTNEKNYHKE